MPRNYPLPVAPSMGRVAPVRQRRPMLLAAAGALTLAALQGPAVHGDDLFAAQAVQENRFAVLARPVGSDDWNLLVLEQLAAAPRCWTSRPDGLIDPSLNRFNFAGICSRYIDANGYSLRVGGSDLATSYRLMVRSEPNGTVLVALPTKAGAGPEMIVARSGGPIGGFHKLQPEPGWMLMRRTYGGRRLGHLYVYSANWPGAETVGSQPAAGSAPAATSAPVAVPASQGAQSVPAKAGSGSKPSGAASAPAAAAAPSTPPASGRPPVAPPKL